MSISYIMIKARTRGRPLKEKDLKNGMLVWLDYFEPYISKENRQLFVGEMGIFELIEYTRYGATAFILREPGLILKLSGYTEFEYAVHGDPERVCIIFDKEDPREMIILSLIEEIEIDDDIVDNFSSISRAICQNESQQDPSTS